MIGIIGAMAIEVEGPPIPVDVTETFSPSR